LAIKFLLPQFEALYNPKKIRNSISPGTIIILTKGKSKMDPLRPRRAVFLDRDGTIIEDTGFLRRAEEVRLLPGAAEGMRELQGAGFALIVVTNQSGVARGIIAPAELGAVRERFFEVMREEGIQVTDYFYCPHHIRGEVTEFRKDCADRKGSPGMLLRGAAKHGIFLPGSWMVGDRTDDVRAGKGCGVRTIQIRHPGQGENPIAPDFFADNLLEAGRIILRSL
jgi:D-glycero-D-manno-heptose 1,7-bisphosphate phosphatase